MFTSKVQLFTIVLLQIVGVASTEDNVLCITGDKDALTVVKGKRCLLSAWTTSTNDCNFDSIKLETRNEESIGVYIGVMQEEGGYYEVMVYCETNFCTKKDFQALKESMAPVTVSDAACNEKFISSLESAWNKKWKPAFDAVRYISPTTTWETKSQHATL